MDLYELSFTFFKDFCGTISTVVRMKYCGWLKGRKKTYGTFYFFTIGFCGGSKKGCPSNVPFSF
jgi:hypothetical protein